jgi:hypothetical protein
MAVRHITSDPKPSLRHGGWHYAYYSKQTAAGGECTVIFPPSISDIVKKGFAFDDSCVIYDEVLKASVLTLDFGVDEPEPQELPEPSLPLDPESGWGDPDRLPASPPAVRSEQLGELVASGGVRPSAVRRRQAQEQAIKGCQLPAAFLKINLEVSRSFLLQYALISSSVGEARRADVAQKLCAIASIPYFRQVGIELTEDDVKGMTSY